MLQSGLRSIVNTQQLQAVQQQTFDDAELICTGKQMKWISVSLSYQASQFVFIDAPEEAPEVNHLCPNETLTEPNHLLATNSVTVLQQYVSYRAKVSQLVQRPYTAFPYTHAQTRAPPHFS